VLGQKVRTFALTMSGKKGKRSYHLGGGEKNGERGGGGLTSSEAEAGGKGKRRFFMFSFVVKTVKEGRAIGGEGLGGSFYTGGGG